MSTAPEKPLDERRIVAALALQCHLPVDDVAKVYEEERAGLAMGARVTKFLPIFAIRNVQETLRKRGADKQVMASSGAALLAMQGQ